MKYFYLISIIVLSFHIRYHLAKSNDKNVVVDNIIDVKDFKKVLRTKTNVLVCFTKSPKQSAQIIKIFKEAAVIVKGQGTMVLVDCSGEAKKMCKKLKISPEPYVLKHYKDGEFNKDYDRRETVNSMVNFMRDPTGDIPWEEDSSATDVIHIPDANSLNKFIKKETKPIMVMFYAPWCGFCKSLKPEYAAAAAELGDQAVLAAIDVNRPENAAVRTQYNITGFPTLLYYRNGMMKYQYEGDNNKQGIVSFMRNPHAPPVKIKEPEWSDTDSEVVHLSSSNFDPVMKEEASVLVMFYAPWCGHCKRMKPEYEKAAAVMKTQGISGMLVAVDATKEQSIASRYNIKGYPSVKYFSYGEEKFDVNVREANKIVDFMENPKEPPPPPPPEKPWSEEKSEVVHLNEDDFKTFLKKKKHVLVMFYAPWCGHCKKAKPEFTNAAEYFKDDAKVVFAAVDCTAQQSLCIANDIKGYPTIKYFSYYSKLVKPYTGGRTENDFIQFMLDPDNPKPNFGIKTSTNTNAVNTDLNKGSTIVLELNDSNFVSFISGSGFTLVMFHAPWCTHCNKMKPAYAQAAEELKANNIPATFAMFDCTTNPVITDEYSITGFPTIMLFKNGKFIANYSGSRTSEDLKRFILGFHNKKDEL